CFAFWCFPCFACKTAKDFGECLCLPLLDFSGIVPPITMAMRVGARHRYGIEGTMCKDCLYATFCPWCSWCQISREMKMRNEQIILVNANSGPVPTRRM
ncbi:CNFNA protein, partial [Atractosteus spatula]|nr:CNFNA protein [Atractosteus spatula]